MNGGKKFMNLTKSIDFLLENAGPVIQYRLRKEILHDLDKTEEENLLEQIYPVSYTHLSISTSGGLSAKTFNIRLYTSLCDLSVRL